MDFKSSIRTHLRHLRSDLSAPDRAKYDAAIRQHLSVLVKSRQSHSIAAFWPFNGEPDITPLFRQWLAEGIQIALPVVSGSNDHTMKFLAYHPDTALVKNRYGIPEPAGSEQVSISGYDLLVLPLVGYDRRGNRLGMGSGYYDRHLASVRKMPAPLRVGIAYSQQELDSIGENSWDIPLHGVVNERGWFTFVE